MTDTKAKPNPCPECGEMREAGSRYLICKKSGCFLYGLKKPYCLICRNGMVWVDGAYVCGTDGCLDQHPKTKQSEPTSATCVVHGNGQVEGVVPDRDANDWRVVKAYTDSDGGAHASRKCAITADIRSILGDGSYAMILAKELACNADLRDQLAALLKELDECEGGAQSADDA